MTPTQQNIYDRTVRKARQVLKSMPSGPAYRMVFNFAFYRLVSIRQASHK